MPCRRRAPGRGGRGRGRRRAARARRGRACACRARAAAAAPRAPRSSETVRAPRSCASPIRRRTSRPSPARRAARGGTAAPTLPKKNAERGETRPLDPPAQAGCARAAPCRSPAPTAACRSSARARRSTKPTSKRALCATSTASPANAENRRSAVATRGARRSSSSESPVSRPIGAGSGTPGRDERLEGVPHLEPAHAHGADLADPRRGGCEPGRLEVEDDEGRILERGVLARDERDERPAPDEAAVLLDERREQRPGEPLRHLPHREEVPGGLVRQHRPPPAPPRARPAGRASRSPAAPAESKRTYVRCARNPSTRHLWREVPGAPAASLRHLFGPRASCGGRTARPRPSRARARRAAARGRARCRGRATRA